MKSILGLAKAKVLKTAGNVKSFLFQEKYDVKKSKRDSTDVEEEEEEKESSKTISSVDDHVEEDVQPPSESKTIVNETKVAPPNQSNITIGLDVVKKFELGDFEITEKIGSGNFGEVHKAVHRVDGFVCALKEMKTQQSNHELFKREVLIHHKMSQHVGVVDVVGYIESENRMFIVLQHALGSTLGFRKELGLMSKVRIVTEIAEALLHLHRSGIIHRDIKLDNILLMKESNSTKLIPKICDFGCAIEKSAFLPQRTGTPIYMPPEIYHRRNVTRESDYSPYVHDIYSFGILIFEFFSNLSFQDEVRKEMELDRSFRLSNVLGNNILDHIGNGLRPNLNRYSVIPVSIRRIIGACWAKESERIQSLGGVVRQLKSAVTSCRKFLYNNISSEVSGAKVYCGIINSGNYCPISSILQLLYRTRGFVESVQLLRRHTNDDVIINLAKFFTEYDEKSRILGGDFQRINIFPLVLSLRNLKSQNRGNSEQRLHFSYEYEDESSKDSIAPPKIVGVQLKTFDAGEFFDNVLFHIESVAKVTSGFDVDRFRNWFSVITTSEVSRKHEVTVNFTMETLIYLPLYRRNPSENYPNETSLKILIEKGIFVDEIIRNEKNIIEETDEYQKFYFSDFSRKNKVADFGKYVCFQVRLKTGRLVNIDDQSSVYLQDFHNCFVKSDFEISLPTTKGASKLHLVQVVCYRDIEPKHYIHVQFDHNEQVAIISDDSVVMKIGMLQIWDYLKMRNFFPVIFVFWNTSFPPIDFPFYRRIGWRTRTPVTILEGIQIVTKSKIEVSSRSTSTDHSLPNLPTSVSSFVPKFGVNNSLSKSFGFPPLSLDTSYIVSLGFVENFVVVVTNFGINVYDVSSSESFSKSLGSPTIPLAPNDEIEIGSFGMTNCLSFGTKSGLIFFSRVTRNRKENTVKFTEFSTVKVETGDFGFSSLELHSSASREIILIGCSNGNIALNYVNPKLPPTLFFNDSVTVGSVTGLYLHGNSLVCCYSTGVKVWDVSSKRCIQEENHTHISGGITCFSINPSETRLVIGGKSERIVIYCIRNISSEIPSPLKKINYIGSLSRNSKTPVRQLSFHLSGRIFSVISEGASNVEFFHQRAQDRQKQTQKILEEQMKITLERKLKMELQKNDPEVTEKNLRERFRHDMEEFQSNTASFEFEKFPTLGTTSVVCGCSFSSDDYYQDDDGVLFRFVIGTDENTLEVWNIRDPLNFRRLDFVNVDTSSSRRNISRDMDSRRNVRPLVNKSTSKSNRRSVFHPNNRSQSEAVPKNLSDEEIIQVCFKKRTQQIRKHFDHEKECIGPKPFAVKINSKPRKLVFFTGQALRRRSSKLLVFSKSWKKSYYPKILDASFIYHVQDHSITCPHHMFFFRDNLRFTRINATNQPRTKGRSISFDGKEFVGKKYKCAGISVCRNCGSDNITKCRVCRCGNRRSDKGAGKGFIRIKCDAKLICLYSQGDNSQLYLITQNCCHPMPKESRVNRSYVNEVKSKFEKGEIAKSDLTGNNVRLDRLPLNFSLPSVTSRLLNARRSNTFLNGVIPQRKRGFNGYVDIFQTICDEAKNAMEKKATPNDIFFRGKPKSYYLFPYYRGGSGNLRERPFWRIFQDKSMSERCSRSKVCGADSTHKECPWIYPLTNNSKKQKKKKKKKKKESYLFCLNIGGHNGVTEAYDLFCHSRFSDESIEMYCESFRAFGRNMESDTGVGLLEWWDNLDGFIIDLNLLQISGLIEAFRREGDKKPVIKFLKKGKGCVRRHYADNVVKHARLIFDRDSDENKEWVGLLKKMPYLCGNEFKKSFNRVLAIGKGVKGDRKKKKVKTFLSWYFYQPIIRSLLFAEYSLNPKFFDLPWSTNFLECKQKDTKINLKVQRDIWSQVNFVRDLDAKNFSAYVSEIACGEKSTNYRHKQKRNRKSYRPLATLEHKVPESRMEFEKDIVIRGRTNEISSYGSNKSKYLENNVTQEFIGNGLWSGPSKEKKSKDDDESSDDDCSDDDTNIVDDSSFPIPQPLHQLGDFIKQSKMVQKRKSVFVPKKRVVLTNSDVYVNRKYDELNPTQNEILNLPSFGENLSNSKVRKKKKKGRRARTGGNQNEKKVSKSRKKVRKKVKKIIEQKKPSLEEKPTNEQKDDVRKFHEGALRPQLLLVKPPPIENPHDPRRSSRRPKVSEKFKLYRNDPSIFEAPESRERKRKRDDESDSSDSKSLKKRKIGTHFTDSLFSIANGSVTNRVFIKNTLDYFFGCECPRIVHRPMNGTIPNQYYVPTNGIFGRRVYFLPYEKSKFESVNENYVPEPRSGDNSLQNSALLLGNQKRCGKTGKIMLLVDGILFSDLHAISSGGLVSGVLFFKIARMYMLEYVRVSINNRILEDVRLARADLYESLSDCRTESSMLSFPQRMIRKAKKILGDNVFLSKKVLIPVTYGGEYCLVFMRPNPIQLSNEDIRNDVGFDYLVSFFEPTGKYNHNLCSFFTDLLKRLAKERRKTMSFTQVEMCYPRMNVHEGQSDSSIFCLYYVWELMRKNEIGMSFNSREFRRKMFEILVTGDVSIAKRTEV